MARLILGLNTDHGDAAAALMGQDGMIAAIAQERLDRKKHSAIFPGLAVAEVLRIAGAEIRDVTDIAIARDPWANFAAKALFVVQHPASGLPLALKRAAVHRRAAGVRERLAEALAVDAGSIKANLHRVEHHLAHVASAYYWSPFERAAALTIDGAGDFATTMSAHCRGNEIRVRSRTHWPHSLGVFYTAICQFAGFDRYGDEYKVMGLSAYGENRFGELMRRLVDYRPETGLRLDLSYFAHQHNRGSFETIEDGAVVLPQLWGPKLAETLGPPRARGAEITARERDLAASMQRRYEEVFLEMVRAVVAETGERRLVLAGGGALNSVANGKMITGGYVDEAYFQPAASDDGTAVGAAAYVLHAKLGVPRQGAIRSAMWGPQWTDDAIERALEASGLPYRKLERAELLRTAAAALGEGLVMGWFQGREEWGPRALGNRSILCDPSRPEMKDVLNSRIKHREPFRPFAPVIREEDLGRCFAGTHPSPFMIVVYEVRPEWRPRLPAITHADGTGRVQTVRRGENPLYYDLLTEFEAQTGVPVLINTSFNENEPIVHTPEQALATYARTKMDCLGIGSFWLRKGNEAA